MAVQFGSGSSADRRRRRLAVGADANVDAALLESDGGDIESELVASEAAAPWVPVTEFRIWIYSAVIGLVLAAMTFVLLHPIPLPVDFAPIAEHLLGGTRPLALVFVETILLALSTQLAVLICWYRARCKIDFGGRYRVWPWAVALIGIGAFCTATNIHLVIAGVLGRSAWLPWRGATVAWLLPFCVAALPMTLLIDRDVRNSSSSLWVLRLSGSLWLAASLLEIYRPELQSRNWFNLTYQLVPVYACATLFIGLWLHARIVAYVCPDPPELDERSAWSVLKSAFIWIACRMLFWKRAGVGADVEEEEEKPKRRRKKADGDETTTRRKRRTPAKRPAARTRTRTKSTDDEDPDDSNEAASDPEVESVNQSTADSSSNSDSWDESSEDSNEQPVQSSRAAMQASSAPKVMPKAGERNTQIHNAHGSSVPAPHSRFPAGSWNNQQESDESEDNDASGSGGSNDDSDDDQQYPDDARISPEQFKGLSKRQKRDLKKQLRDQQRARGR